MREHQKLLELKLIHNSGNLTCNVAFPSYSSKWGCGHDGHKKSWTVITDPSKRELFSSHGIIPHGFTPQNADSLVYKPEQTILTGDSKGLDLQIWYTEDLYDEDRWDTNNGGKHCVDVLAKTERVPGNNLNILQIPYIVEKNREYRNMNFLVTYDSHKLKSFPPAAMFSYLPLIVWRSMGMINRPCLLDSVQYQQYKIFTLLQI